ncbi:hypothetical protein [Propionispora sp. 2/2-37]|uniref:hypothetical protein n=1 Tax=Propionispora sp. 2/2-37 TaxID=1677858 RepID=UPI0012E245C1|nr:hypothetical protein [Propionispora sp. 2/2-37]
MARKKRKAALCPACRSPLKEVLDADGQPDLICTNVECKFAEVTKLSGKKDNLLLK